MSTPTTYPSPAAQPADDGAGQGVFARFADARRAGRLATWAGKAFTDARSARIRNERQWYLNLAFYAGRQNVEFRPSVTTTLGTQLIVPKAPPWRQRLVINRIRPMIRTETAKLTATRPSMTVIPSTNTDEDAAAARTGEQLLTAFYSDLEIDHVLRTAVWWSANCGTSFIKDYWHPQATDPVTNTAGKICVEAVDPFHLLVPDLREADLDGQPWVMHATTRSPEWVRRYYGQEVAQANMTPSTDMLFEDVMWEGGGKQASKAVLCLEVWVQPGGHPEMPDGGVLTVVGGKLLGAPGRFYRHRQVPFTKFEHIPMGRFYGEAVTTDLIPLQRELNRTRSQLAENKNMLGRPKLLAVEGSVDAGKITSEPGQVVYYKQFLGKPEVLPVPGIPSYIMDTLDRITGDMDDISGQHEISRGGAPPQVTAATAISYLQEADDTKLSYTVASIERGMARLGRHLLSHVVEFWNVQRTVRVVGVDGTFDAMYFSGSALRGNTDVRVQAGSALPTSKAARQAFLIDVFKMGGFGPIGDPKTGQKLFEVLGLAGVDRVIEDYQVDVRQAQRENTRMSMGQQLQVNSYDDHATHLVIHNRFRKGQQFETFDDQTKQLFAEHCFMHEQLLAAATGMVAGPGGEPGQPPGSPPAGPGGSLGPSQPGGA